MTEWTSDEVRSYFESGGVSLPHTASGSTVAPADAGTTSHVFAVIKLFGDSHANSFISLAAPSKLLLAYPYTAGSAMGLRHADSISGYRVALERDLQGTNSDEAIVLKFGQVDLDFVFYLKWVDDRSLAFDSFAADSVRKYFSFVDDALARGLVRREQLHIMSPFPTVVGDAALRESLCTLPFMQPAFKQAFRAKLEALALPSLAERTQHGRAYCEQLRLEASARGLRYVDMYSPLLGADDVCVLLNTDSNHHLVEAHWPWLCAPLSEAFGGSFRVADFQSSRSAQSMVARAPATAAPSLTLAAAGGGRGGEQQALLEWVTLFQSLRAGRVGLRLHGHAVGTYEHLEAAFGAPLPLQLSAPTARGPGFATWLARFSDGVVVRILGRYRCFDESHAWLVEASAPGGMDAVRHALGLASPHTPSIDKKPRAVEVDLPPPSFLAALSGRR